jgi:hypothetical protein
LWENSSLSWNMINYLLVVSVSSTILNIRLVELFIIHDKCKLCRLGECCDCLCFAINRMHWVLGYCTYLWFNLRSPNYCESFYCKNEHGYQKGSTKNKKENIQEHFTYFASLKQYWDVNTSHPSLSPLPLLSPSLSLSLSLSPMHPIYSDRAHISEEG